MKAAVFPRKKELILSDLPQPVPGPGEALVQVLYAGICGSDIHVWQGEHATATYPRVPGHEFVGILREFNGIPRMELAPGDLVAVQPYDSCGVCEPCVTGRSNVCRSLSVLGIHRDGCFAEYITVPANKVYRLPPELDYKVAALIEPLAVAVHDVRSSGLKVGQNVLIIGGGPIGMLMAMVAAHMGASLVTISEIIPSRLDFIREMGFDVINPAKEDLQQAALSKTKGRGYDIVFEVSGSRPGVESMTNAVKIGGTVMVIGMSSQKHPVDTGAMFYKELQLKGVRLHSQEAFEGAVEIVSTGKLNSQLIRLVDRVFPLSQVVEAMHYQMEDKEHFKVLLDVAK